MLLNKGEAMHSLFPFPWLKMLKQITSSCHSFLERTVGHLEGRHCQVKGIRYPETAQELALTGGYPGSNETLIKTTFTVFWYFGLWTYITSARITAHRTAQTEPVKSAHYSSTLKTNPGLCATDIPDHWLAPGASKRFFFTIFEHHCPT